MLVIRPETLADVASIHAVNSEAFPTAAEAGLVDRLRAAGSLTLSLVAEEGGTVIGHIAFSPVTVDCGARVDGVGLAPMAVLPAFQRRGVGSALVREALARLSAQGRGFVALVGHPAYYPRFGFTRGSAFGLRWEHEVPDEVFLIRELRADGLDGVSGTLRFAPEFDALIAAEEEASAPPVTLEAKGEVGVLRLSNGPANPLSPQLVAQLGPLARHAGRECRALLVAGGEKFLSIGLDLKSLLLFSRGELEAFLQEFTDALATLHTLPIPTAVVARGHAVAGGFTLLVTGDFRYAASGRTLLGLNEVKLGLPVPYGSDLMLRAIAGDATATELAFTGEFIDAQRALEKGLLTAVFSKEEVEERALEQMEALAALPAPALTAMKAMRVAPFRALYEANGARFNREFAELWFRDETQALLHEAAKKI